MDEIQQVPKLLSYIQVIVDQDKKCGQYILTGSHQLMLHDAISQSLAGRTALLTLFPMTVSELLNADVKLELDEYLLNGFFPRVWADKLNPTKAYRNYFQTYIERDVRQISNIKDISQFQRFVKLCAGRIGQVLNKEGIGNELGISGNTINQWLSILEASFIIFLLPPYFENFGKRMIKSPKLYFTDPGLACYLLGIENVSQVSRDPLRGFLAENLVILELIKARLNIGLDPQLYYYRDNHQNEVDAIYKVANNLIPIEIKASVTFNSGFLRGLNFYQNLADNRVNKKYLVYAGEYEQQINNIHVINFRNTHKIISI